MPVNPITGIVTYTLDEWKEESQLWERDGALREQERMTRAVIERYPNHIVEVIDRGMGETYKSHENCPQCVALALIKGKNK